jgi:hypothetical protein
MRSILILITTLSLLFAKDINHKVQSIKKDATSSSFTRVENGSQVSEFRTSREDTTTIWFEDFEGDISGWIIDSQWELTETESNSPTHSLYIDDSNYDTVSAIISPIMTFPEIDENSGISFSFALNCNLPDADGDGDGYLEDYYFCEVADISNSPWHTSDNNAFEGNSWWCGSEDVGGYLDGWLQFLDTPDIDVPAEGTTDLTFKMFYAIEIPGDYPPYNGWDAANIRISTDNFATWSVLNGAPAYDFTSGYGWGYNGEGADIPGWGGYSGGDAPGDWVDGTFDLSAYAGQNVKIRFAFGSDPAYSTIDDPSIIGFFVDNVEVSNSSSGVLFTNNGDDQSSMTPQGIAWNQVFYDYGDITRPGGLGWDSYDPGDPFNGNIMLDLSDLAGSDVRFRWRVRLDDNDDGGNGDGFFIDDIHVWEVNYNVIPTVQNLNIYSEDSQVLLTWDMPPSESYNNDEVSNDDGAPENSWAISAETVKYGSVFDMPYGTESVVVHSASFAPNSLDDQPISAGIEAYNVSPIGIPETVPVYSTTATLEDETWTSIEFSNWTFSGDFLIALVVDSTVYMSIDEDASTAYSYIASPDFVSDDWFPVNYFDIGGEWLIRSVVTTTGTAVEPGFNVYRDPGMFGIEWQLMFNGSNISTNEYVDSWTENGIEYCYKVSAVYGAEESDLAGPVCATPESNTIYEIAYDDGSAETSQGVGMFNSYAVKFTPFGYPADLYRTSIYNVDVGPNNGVGKVRVWDDDGENGLPGTILYESFPITFVGDTWKYFSLSDFNITITEGSFYIGVMEMDDQIPDFGIDTPNPSTFSYISIDNTWYPFSDALSNAAIMIRAELDSMNALGIEDGFTGNIPESFGLKQNFPNPFNPTTTIEFDLASGAFASIVLYDVTGREVKTLVNSNLQAGHYVFDLNASELSSGMYFYKLTAQNFDGQMIFSSTKKMVLMK